jgi:hypothetical protein
MAELLRLFLDLMQWLSPVRTVWTWQRGLYFIAGRYQWTVGPGLWPVVPGLCEVHRVSIVPEIATTPMQSITLRGHRPLTFSASFTLVVEDPAKAFNTLGRYQETVVELVARVVSDELADADPDRLEPDRGKRDRLIEAIRKAVDEATGVYGVRVTSLGFNNFAMNVRTIRLLLDRAVLVEGNHLAGG